MLVTAASEPHAIFVVAAFYFVGQLDLGVISRPHPPTDAK
jgi:hypothetical protein